MSKSIQVYVDSTYSIGGKTSNFSYQLKEPIRNAVSFKITSAEIPLTFNKIRSSGADKNNTFIFSENNGATTLTATIVAGYYTSTTLITALVTALNLASANAYTYSITYNTTTGKFTITSTGAFVVMYYNFLSINWIMGYNQVSTSFVSSQTAQTAPFLDYYTYVYVRIGLNFKGNYDETGSKNGIIKIPVTSPQGSIQYYFDPSDNRFDLLDSGNSGINAISIFNMQLLDSDYYEIDLNGRQVSYTITFYYD